jgi:hypothetical protein
MGIPGRLGYESLEHLLVGPESSGVCKGAWRSRIEPEGRGARRRAQRPRSLLLRAHHGDSGASGVAGLDDPCAAGDFGGAVQDLGAAGLRAIGRFGH